MRAHNSVLTIHRRIAMVGDSYVNSLHVDYDSSFGERLETEVTEAGDPVEVYRFGISGAPLIPMFSDRNPL